MMVHWTQLVRQQVKSQKHFLANNSSKKCFGEQFDQQTVRQMKLFKFCSPKFQVLRRLKSSESREGASRQQPNARAPVCTQRSMTCELNAAMMAMMSPEPESAPEHGASVSELIRALCVKLSIPSRGIGAFTLQQSRGSQFASVIFDFECDMVLSHVFFVFFISNPALPSKTIISKRLLM